MVGADMSDKPFLIDFQWPTQEPFLFCVHHRDLFPAGDKDLGVASEALQGREIGSDFELKNGFRMYHGDRVPGFPVHPHRGFETITIVRKGYVDHADSMGAAGRYGEGDVQWMTAGAGVQHSEMMPLLRQDQENLVELFQIWLNLPSKKKMVSPHFKMFWSEAIPKISLAEGRVEVSVIAGEYDGVHSLKPPPDSWAVDPQNEVLILLVKIKDQGSMVLKRISDQTTRSIYFFKGQSLRVNGIHLGEKNGVFLNQPDELLIQADGGDNEFLLLQARAIGEPTVKYGPFVMNSKEEIIRTIHDYQKTEFGGWSWPRPDMVHGPGMERFARFPNGQIEKPK